MPVDPLVGQIFDEPVELGNLGGNWIGAPVECFIEEVDGVRMGRVQRCLILELAHHPIVEIDRHLFPSLDRRLN